MSTPKKTAKLVCASLLVSASLTFVAGAAQAETGWLWYDSVFAAPTAAPRPARLHVVRRAKPVSIVAPVAKPIFVSAVVPAQSESCFWCNRPMYISGLSF
jgi:hypothetical protein